MGKLSYQTSRLSKKGMYSELLSTNLNDCENKSKFWTDLSKQNKDNLKSCKMSKEKISFEWKVACRNFKIKHTAEMKDVSSKE